tara:strand:- start:386 stop:1006 length:621 start_codon:yes stop_codon:yes gene_type:complete
MVKTWDKAIEQNDYTLQKRKELIHPSGFDEIQYFNSGKKDAFDIIEKCNLNKEQKILEFGCGDGRILRHLNNLLNVQGVDIVQKFIEESHNFNLKTCLLDELKENDFNIIYSLTVFIHLNKDDSKKALQYIYDHLKKGGLAYLQILVYGFDKDGTEFINLNFWKKETLIKMAQEIGFKVKHIEEMEGNIHKAQWARNHNDFCIFEK